MDIVELAKMLENNMNKLLNVQGYTKLLDRGNNLIRFDVLNRMLILIQNDKAFDLKTYDEWLMDDRQVNDKEKPISIVLPSYKSEYIEIETGKKLEENDLNHNELVKALEYGIIERVDIIENMYTMKLFDIRQTHSLSGNQYTINKPLLTSKELLNLLVNVLGCKIENCEETYYSKSEKIVYISKKPYEELAITVSKILTQYFMDTIVKSMIETNDKISMTEYDIDLIKESLIYSIGTILGVTIESDFNIVNHTNNSKLITILTIVDSILIEIINYLKFNKPCMQLDATQNINVLKKAEVILNIMEANEIKNTMKGT